MHRRSGAAILTRTELSTDGGSTWSTAYEWTMGDDGVGHEPTPGPWSGTLGDIGTWINNEIYVKGHPLEPLSYSQEVNFHWSVTRTSQAQNKTVQFWKASDPGPGDYLAGSLTFSTVQTLSDDYPKDGQLTADRGLLVSGDATLGFYGINLDTPHATYPIIDGGYTTVRELADNEILQVMWVGPTLGGALHIEIWARAYCSGWDPAITMDGSTFWDADAVQVSGGLIFTATAYCQKALWYMPAGTYQIRQRNEVKAVPAGLGVSASDFYASPPKPVADVVGLLILTRPFTRTVFGPYDGAHMIALAPVADVVGAGGDVMTGPGGEPITGARGT
jgi:hypothetical protein